MRASAVMRLIRKLHSPDSKHVLQAIEELRARGWLSDGSLRGASLQYVHLEGADLYKANLEDADLRHAQMDGANLSLANLQGANLSLVNLQAADLSRANLTGAVLFRANLRSARNLKEEQLAQVHRLRRATLPDGNYYDGRFNLEGDIEFAAAAGIDINDAAAMAEYYGVSLEEYEEGQALVRAQRPGSPISPRAIRAGASGRE